MDKHITHLWKMGRGSRQFRIQTTDPYIARKLQKTNNWDSILIFCNKPVWMFQKSFNTPQDARKKLKSLCKVLKIFKGDDNGEFFAITYANTTLNNTTRR